MFENQIISFIKEKIDNKVQEEDTYSAESIEKESHAQYADKKREHFIGQASLLSTIETYIKDDNQQVMVLYGESGKGKSALMAQAIQQASGNKEKKVIYRFVGATPLSGSTKEILISLFLDLGKDMRHEEEKFSTFSEQDILSVRNIESFEDFCARAYDEIMQIEDEVVIFIDAVDQLVNDDSFLWLPNVLPSNVKIIISALDDSHYTEDSRYFETLKTKSKELHLISDFSETDALCLLENILFKYDRCLQEEQKRYFLQSFTHVKSPFYVMIVAEVLRYMRSDEPISLQETQQNIVQQYIDNLSSTYHHDKALVEKALGYMYASKDGLSESELLELLSVDKAFVKQVAPEEYHQNLTGELPVVLWSRLYTQLKPFLALRGQDDEQLLYFFHREFEDVVSTQSEQEKVHKMMIEAVQVLIEKYQYRPFEENRWGKIYSIIVTLCRLQFHDEIEEYSIKISKMKNKVWIAKYLEYSTKVASDYNLHNMLDKAIIQRKDMVLIIKSLYNNSPTDWEDQLKRSLANLSTSYSNNYNHADALKYSKELDKFFNTKNISGTFEKLEYAVSLSDSSISYSHMNKHDEAIKKAKEAYTILKEYYLQSREYDVDVIKGFIKSCNTLTMVYNHFFSIYNQKEICIEAIRYGEEGKKVYDAHSHMKNMDDVEIYSSFTTLLINIAIAYQNKYICLKDKNVLIKAIALAEESKKLIEYQLNKGDKISTIFIDDYIDTLFNLTTFYILNQDCSRANIIKEKCKKVIKENKNNNRWKEYINNLSLMDMIIKENIEVIKISINILDIIDLTKYFAKIDNSKRMKLVHFLQTLSYVELNMKVKSFISKALSEINRTLKKQDVDTKNSLTEGEKIQEMKSSLDLTMFIEKLKKEFNDNELGLYSYKK